MNEWMSYLHSKILEEVELNDNVDDGEIRKYWEHSFQKCHTNEIRMDVGNGSGEKKKCWIFFNLKI